MRRADRNPPPRGIATRPAPAGPMLPSRARVDPDRIVGFACAVLLPLALWLART